MAKNRSFLESIYEDMPDNIVAIKRVGNPAAGEITVIPPISSAIAMINKLCPVFNIMIQSLVKQSYDFTHSTLKKIIYL